MVKRITYFVCAFALLLFVSCSEDSLETVVDNMNKNEISYKVTPEEAQEIVQEFVDEIANKYNLEYSVISR